MGYPAYPDSPLRQGGPLRSDALAAQGAAPPPPGRLLFRGQGGGRAPPDGMGILLVTPAAGAPRPDPSV